MVVKSKINFCSFFTIVERLPSIGFLIRNVIFAFCIFYGCDFGQINILCVKFQKNEKNRQSFPEPNSLQQNSHSENTRPSFQDSFLPNSHSENNRRGRSSFSDKVADAQAKDGNKKNRKYKREYDDFAIENFDCK